MRRIAIMLVLAGWTATAPARAAPPPAAKVPAAVETFFRDYFRAVEAGDPEGIMRMFDGDFLVRWPGSPPITDRARLRDALAGLQRRVSQRIRWRVIEGAAVDGWAWARVAETTVHTPRDGGAPRTLNGSHLAILRKVGGRWLLHRDVTALD